LRGRLFTTFNQLFLFLFILIPLLRSVFLDVFVLLDSLSTFFSGRICMPR
jgi:hypothetical protein